MLSMWRKIMKIFATKYLNLSHIEFTTKTEREMFIMLIDWHSDWETAK